ncbi:hypothetical protein EGT07_24435 [Herbaspirillum sp. HC18]|nr:hypothetical protein EGT07_24435 [Herbaspirillum sp. HC18]
MRQAVAGTKLWNAIEKGEKPVRKTPRFCLKIRQKRWRFFHASGDEGGMMKRARRARANGIMHAAHDDGAADQIIGITMS